ncbi:MAG: hydantoinase/oxoprolinase family protein [Blastocatellia bacterium]|nr:hydantoinase/oxoprolinase family protein [Blastocatellia bacterium]
MLRIGVDTGGTFTDLVLLDGERLVVHKVRSTPDDPSRAIVQGIREILSLAEIPLPVRASRPDIVHGTTVATNALLERKGARVALLTTSGFEDVLAIGRQTRKELYNFNVQPRLPLVERAAVVGIPERLEMTGNVLEPLDETRFPELLERLTALQVEAVAVCLLHSYVNPTHEQTLARMLTQAGLQVSASSDILPEYREFERWSTTVVNAYVQPVMARYVGALTHQLATDETLAASGPPKLGIMQSNGGTISADMARAKPVHTILSGPAGGVVGAEAVAKAGGFSRIITFDMGGTSTDVATIDGRPGLTVESTVGGFPVRIPVIDIHTVGAGGGSIAFIDSGGALRVGPRSAGADPGPVCYGKGQELTVTDANLLLGRLDPDLFFGGRLRLDLERTRAVACDFAARLHLSVEELAEGIIRIANANMERAIRLVSVQRGYDTRDFALVAFGGAGGLHACALAEALEIPTVLIPRCAGVLSALGMLLADVTKDFSQTVLQRVDGTVFSVLEDQFEPLLAKAHQTIVSEGFSEETSRLERSLDVRYVGQSFEINVPLSVDFAAVFHREHERLYGYANPHRAVEVVNIRVKAIGFTTKPALPWQEPGKAVVPVPARTRQVYFQQQQWETAIWRQAELIPGASGNGPAVITGGEATIVIPPGFQFRVDGFENVIATRLELSVSART